MTFLHQQKPPPFVGLINSKSVDQRPIDADSVRWPQVLLILSVKESFNCRLQVPSAPAVWKNPYCWGWFDRPFFFWEFPKMVPSNHPVMDHDLVLKPMDTYGPMGIPHFKKPPIPLCHGGPVFLMERSATGSAQPKQWNSLSANVASVADPFFPGR